MASLLDVFNASARLASQGLDIYSREKKEEADLYVQNRLLRLQEEGQRYLNDIANGVIGNDYDDFTAGWETRVNKWYGESLKGLNSPYVMRRLQYMSDYNRSTMLPQLENASEIRRSRRRNDIRENNIELYNLTAQSPSQKINYAAGSINQAFEFGDMDYNNYIPEMKNKYLSIGLSETVAMVDGLLAAGAPYDRILGSLERYIQQELPDSISILNPEGGWADGGSERPTRGFTEEPFDTRPMKAQIRARVINHLDDQWKKKPKVERTPISEVVRSIESLRNSLLEGGIVHNYNGEEITVEKSFEMFLAGVDAILLGNGYDLGDKDLLFSKEIGAHTYFADLGQALKKLDPNFTESSFIPLEAVFDSIANDKNLKPELKKKLSRQVTQSLFDLIWDMGLYSRSTEEWLATGKDLAEKTVAGKIDLVQLTEDGKSQLKNLMGNSSDKDRIALYEQLHENPEAVTETAGRVNYLGNLETYQNLQGWAAQDIVRNLGLPADILDTGKVRVDWDKEAGKEDLAPVPVVSLTGTGKDGTYKYDLKSTKDFYGRDTNVLALYKKDSRGNWQEMGTGTAEAQARENYQENRGQEIDRRAADVVRTGIENLAETMKNESFYAGKSAVEIRGEILSVVEMYHIPVKDLLLALIEKGANPFGGGDYEDLGERIRGMFPGVFDESEIAEIESRLRK
jgi:hypothetical protein